MTDKNNNLILKKKIKRTKFLIFIFAILLIILISLKIIYYISAVNQLLNEVVLPNTQIETIDVGGLNRKQLENVSQKHINSLMEKKLTVRLEKTKQTYTYQDLGIMYDSNNAIQKIFNQQVKDNWSGWFKQLAAKIGLRKLNYKLEPKFNNNKLHNLISNEFTKFQAPPINASIKMSDTNSEVYYVDEKIGKKVNINMLQKDIIEAIYNGTDSVVVKYTNIYPDISNLDLKKINMKKPMSEFKTDLIGRSDNTRENIEKAANKLNGVIIPSDKEFSFNEIVGLTDQTHGYKNAPVILNNKLIQAAGGGVCQVSSTLYNAVLLANLDIVSRINHSHQVSYVPAGLDATVADNGPDFKFKNNTDTPIYIKTILQNNQLVIKLYGKTSDDIVNIYTNTTKKTDFLVKVNTYREVKNKDNNLKTRELISTSTYKNK